METTFSVDGSHGNKFPSIYNHCTHLWRPEVARRWKTKFLKVFVAKWPLIRGNFPNFVPKAFIATLVDVLCSNLVKFGRRQLGKVVSCLSDKNNTSPGSSALATAQIATEICQDQPRECTHSASVFIQIGSLSADLFPNAWTPLKRAVKCFQHSAKA